MAAEIPSEILTDSYFGNQGRGGTCEVPIQRIALDNVPSCEALPLPGR